MGDNSGLELDTYLTFIEFNDQQIANIGAALQAVADQIERPKVDQQLLNNYQVDRKSSCVDNTKGKVETLINSTSFDGTYVSSQRNNDKAVVKAGISNQLLLESSNDLSSYLTKEEPQIQEYQIEHPSFLNETENWSYSNLSNSEKDAKMIIYPIVIDSRSIEQKTISTDYNKFINYICPECGEDCGPHSNWKLHIETQHTIEWLKFISKTTVDGNSFYQCLKCNLKLCRKPYFTVLQEHHIKHMLHKDYLKCKSCDKRFKSSSAIYSHIKENHTQIDFKIKRSNTNMKYIKIFCPFCQQSQSDIKEWRQHLTEKHDYKNKAKSQTTQLSESLYSCQVCLQKIRKDYIHNHMLIHESENSFQCILCKKYAPQLSSAVQHLKRRHSTTLLGIGEQNEPIDTTHQTFCPNVNF